MKQFKPREFQKEVFDNIYSIPRKTLLQLPPRSRGKYTSIGVDMAQASGDKTVIAQAQVNKNGITMIYFDEYSEWPNYKWYRNPIKWWKWRRMMEKLAEQVDKYRSPNHNAEPLPKHNNK